MIDLLIYIILPIVLICLEYWLFRNFYYQKGDGTFKKVGMPRLIAILLVIAACLFPLNIILFGVLLVIYPFAEADKSFKLSPFKDITGMKVEEVFGPKPTIGERIINFLVGNLWKGK